MAKIKRKAFTFLDRRRRGYEITIKSLPSSANPLAFRKPGSMKRGKGR